MRSPQRSAAGLGHAVRASARSVPGLAYQWIRLLLEPLPPLCFPFHPLAGADRPCQVLATHDNDRTPHPHDVTGGGHHEHP